MTDLPRQQQPVTVWVESNHPNDRDTAATEMIRYLEKRYDDLNVSKNGHFVVISCYPRAVND
jgi:hypothetical protein